jgi:hypothetical protein
MLERSKSYCQALVFVESLFLGEGSFSIIACGKNKKSLNRFRRYTNLTEIKTG